MSDTNEKQVKREKKNNSILVTCLVIALMIVCGFGGWLLGAMKIADKCKNNNVVEQQKSNNEETIDNSSENSESTKEETTTVAEESKPKCYGTYYSEGLPDTEEWVLKEDGTFILKGHEYFGIYVINSNTITFIESKHTTGPYDQDPIYSGGKSYLISDDCERIVIRKDDSTNYTISRAS